MKTHRSRLAQGHALGPGSVARARRVLGMLALTGLLVILAAAIASASEAPEFEYVGSFGPDGSDSSVFEAPPPVAVDQGTHRVYVLDPVAKALFQFDEEGSPVPFGGSSPYIAGNEITGLTTTVGPGETQVAVNSSTHTIYVTSANSVRAFDQEGEPSLFSAGPAAGTSTIGGFSELTGLAVDENGAIYASDFIAEEVKVFAPSGEPLTEFASTQPANLAVDTHGSVYVNKFRSGVRKYTPSEVPATAFTTYTASYELDTEASAYTVAVDPATDNVFVGTSAVGFEKPRVRVYNQAGTQLAEFAGAGEAGEVDEPVGIAIGDASGRIFVGSESAARSLQVEVFIPKPPGPPVIESASATEVTGDSATLVAWVDPNRAPTTYRFEYGLGDCSTSTCVSVPLAPAAIGSGNEGVRVSQGITGLSPNQTYHYRVVTENSEGTTVGPDGTFTTLVGGLGFRLPDGRVWEMVSPADKHGAVLTGSSSGQIQAAADGNGLAYLSSGSIEESPEGARTEPVSVLARRGGAGWLSKDISPPNANAAGVAVGLQGEYKLFSPDLARAVLDRRDDNPLSPEASERTSYLRENTEPPAYRPLVTGKEGYANVPAGTQFGSGSIKIRGASPDLSHVVLTAEAPLAEGAPRFALYEWAAGQLRPVSVLPASDGGGIVSSVLGSDEHSTAHAVSSDGSRIFWTRTRGEHLYLRDTVAEETAPIDVVQPGASGDGTLQPVFQGASPDGSVVFFTDGQRLTADASPAGIDLYRCELPLGGSLTGCTSLTDLSASVSAPGERAEVQGMISDVTDGGNTTYFVAEGRLDASPNRRAETATGGEPNLYLWRQGQGVRFIATLAQLDRADWGESGFTPPPGKSAGRSTASSPDGRYLLFMSQRSLTGADNHDAVTGDPVQELFSYDSVDDRLRCVSCKPTGAAPVGKSIDDSTLSAVDPQDQWGGLHWTGSAGRGPLLGVTLPGATVIQEDSISMYSPRAVFDSGRVFFNSPDALVPADNNDQWDVYEYEPDGTGDCPGSVGGASIVRSAGGCVALVSSGTGEEEAAFLDASASGDDAFFLTSARLSVFDEDRELDIYDARVGGVAATRLANPECLGEACQPAIQPPNDPTPASAAFSGHGNVKPAAGRRCGKGRRAVKRHHRRRCVPRKHRHPRAHGGRRTRR